jgi:hypothetical protein
MYVQGSLKMGKNLNSSPFLRGLEGDLFKAPNTVAAAQIVAVATVFGALCPS